MKMNIAQQFFDISVGALVEDDKKRYRVTHLISVDSVLAVELEGGNSRRLPIESLRRVVKMDGSFEDASAPKDLAAYSVEDWHEAQRRFEAIKGLLENPLRTRSDAETMARNAGVHVATLYRWLHDYIRAGHVAALVPAKRGRRSGTNMLSPDVDAIVQSVIEDYYLSKQSRTPDDAIEEVQRRCRLAKLPPPHPNTVRNRLHHIPDLVRLKRRGRRDEANNRYLPIRGTIETATHPFALVQIDHTPADIIVVDEVHRRPIGRPYVTLAIDVFSRMVAGLYISMDPPSSASVGLCLAHAMCPKREYLASLGVPGSWPVWGRIAVVHADNAKEFRGVALERGAEQHRIGLQWRPPATPRYGGHIERYVGTVMRHLHKLPGTTFSNTRMRRGYDSESEAVLTLKELEVEIVDFIVNKYHQRIHSKLGVSPLKKWEVGIMGTDQQPGLGLMPVPQDPHRLLLDFMPLEERTIQRYGIQLDNITYYDPVLDPYISSYVTQSPSSKAKFIIRRDPRDISRIYFYDPADHSYTILPYRNIGHPPMSLYELREIRKRLTAEGLRDIDEDVIFEALNRSRQRIAEAVHKSKTARRSEARSHPSAKAKNRPHGIASTREASAVLVSSEPSISAAAKNFEDDDIFSTPVRPFDEFALKR
jgi:putative transposase